MPEGSVDSSHDGEARPERQEARPANVWSFLTGAVLGVCAAFQRRALYVVMIVLILKGDKSLVDAVAGMLKPSWSVYWAIAATVALVCVGIAWGLTHAACRRRIDELADERARLQEKILGEGRISSGRTPKRRSGG
jgi:hypothetical protein